jgi:hypothetical protein
MRLSHARLSPAGARLPLPEGYTGLVLTQQQREPEGCEEAPSSCWTASASFKALHYWNHDAVPAKTDTMRRCLEWAQLAAQVGPSPGSWQLLTQCQNGEPAFLSLAGRGCLVSGRLRGTDSAQLLEGAAVAGLLPLCWCC